MANSPFQAKFTGPFTVVRRVSNQNYLLPTPKRRKVTQLCHLNVLKPYYARESKPLSTAGAEGVSSLQGRMMGLQHGRKFVAWKNAETLRNLCLVIFLWKEALSCLLLFTATQVCLEIHRAELI